MAKKKPIVTNAMRLLQKSKIDFEAIEYEYEGEIGENFGVMISTLTGIPPQKSFKTLVLKGEKNGYLVACIPVVSELDLKKLSKVCGEKSVEMLHSKDLLSLTGYIRGGVSPIGMKKKFPTYIHSSCNDFDTIGISAGICGCTLLIKPTDLISQCNAKVYDIIK